MRIRLPIGETNPDKTYSMPDPDVLRDAYAVVYRHEYYGERAPTDSETAMVLTLAAGYLDLTMYELGQECCVKKLRDIWRARRARTARAGEGA